MHSGGRLPLRPGPSLADIWFNFFLYLKIEHTNAAGLRSGLHLGSLDSSPLLPREYHIGPRSITSGQDSQLPLRARCIRWVFENGSSGRLKFLIRWVMTTATRSEPSFHRGPRYLTARRCDGANEVLHVRSQESFRFEARATSARISRHRGWT
jgi:hypothetical protein